MNKRWDDKQSETNGEELFGESTSQLDELIANPFGDEIDDEQSVVKKREEAPRTIYSQLSEEDQQRARQLAEQIDTKNYQAVLQYGVAAQSNLSKFSHDMLDHVQTKDTGPVGEVINELMSKIQEVNPEEFNGEKKGVLKKLFGSMKQSVNQVLSKYQKIGSQIDRVAVKLDKSRDGLLDDINMLEKLFQRNREYFDALNIYIAAAEGKLQQLQNETIPKMRKEVNQSGDQMMVQEVNDMIQFADRLEKRMHDLKLSRQITMQSAPQIRMIQNMNQALVEKIQSSILTAIPLWKNQVVIALTLFRQQRAVEAQKQVTETTNELLLKNSEMLKVNSIETAKENEKGVVDVETLKKTQSNLMTTLEETLKIQQEGREKRRHAEHQLINMEQELKQKLLELKENEQ
ncbi:toxic anion resistance protein [Bacillus solimangrovi]|uniref:toxic anion resistance protein n=1 Tax=Bacillus solimangrovi TaxID=1305675 RepID=UPI0009F1A8AA|nr:toxic anion resistance protein [Bacillus solimangrovi]